MWAAWVIPLVFVASVAGVFAMAGWMVAVPLALMLAAAVLAFRYYGRQRGAEEVSWMRDQASHAGPLDKGGIEFTERDRESLSS